MPDAFGVLFENNIRRVPEEIDAEEALSGSQQTTAQMSSTARSDAVQSVFIPYLKREIERLDEEESRDLGTPKQFETRGKRLYAKEMLALWQSWSGQGDLPPDKGE